MVELAAFLIVLFLGVPLLIVALELILALWEVSKQLWQDHTELRVLVGVLVLVIVLCSTLGSKVLEFIIPAAAAVLLALIAGCVLYGILKRFYRWGGRVCRTEQPSRQPDPQTNHAAIKRAPLVKAHPISEQAVRLKSWQERMYRKEKID